MLGTLSENFVRNVTSYPDRTAIIFENHAYSYGDLNARVNRLAHYLSDLGVQQGDGVGLFLNNCVEFAVGFMACQKLGVISSCLNYRLTAGPVAYAVKQEKLKALIFNDMSGDTVAEIMKNTQNCHFICVGGRGPEGAVGFSDGDSYPDTEPPRIAINETDLCNIIHTSGTTGRPKGAAFTHQTQTISALQYCLEMGLDRGHVGMSLAPVVIGAATNFFVAYIFVGAAQVMIGEYEAEKVLRLAADHHVTEMFAVPTQMYQMAEAVRDIDGLDLSPLRLIRTGGSLMAKTLLQNVRDNLHCEIINTYGTTESCTAITTCHTGLEPEDKWESIGKASYFQDVRVVQVGEAGEISPDQQISFPGEGQLINQGSQSIEEYYCTPEEVLSATDDWQFSRDVVRVDEEGYLYPIDRVDNLIISGGENMYPQEIEFHLSKHPLIVDVAVCGTPDEKWGQAIKALIQRKSEELTEEVIEKYCLEESELPRHKRPRVIEFVETVPRNILGKIDRNNVS